ncbi:MAG: TonB family protein [Bacteroidales bacterium]|nr:TonB family protein [Bacteroidales bacterium]
MAEDKKHSAPNSAGILNYLKGLLSDREKHAWEKAMMRDPFEEEAFEGLSTLSKEELEADINSLKHRLEERVQKKRNRVFTLPRMIAAAVIVLSVGVTVFIILRSLEVPSTEKQMAQNTERATKKKTKSKELYDSTVLAEQGTEAEVLAEEQQSMAKGSEIPESFTTRETKKAPIAMKMEITESDAAITFRESVAELEELVVTGYGSVKKTEITGAAVSLKDESQEKISSGDLEQALAGKASGVEISHSRDAREPEINVMTYDDRMVDNERVIKGVVVSDSEGEPLPGVTVHIKGTTEGTLTDLNGYFAINVPVEEKSTLVFSYIGFLSEEVPIQDQTNINLAMNEDISSLDEVVVIGYGTSKKSDMTGSVSRIEMNDEPAAAPLVIKPKPSVGNSEFKDYIADNINYRNLPAYDKAVVVKLEFTVTAMGNIINIRVAKSGGSAFDDEALRLLENGPSWNPGTVNGTPVDDEADVKIKFEPEP